MNRLPMLRRFKRNQKLHIQPSKRYKGRACGCEECLHDGNSRSREKAEVRRRIDEELQEVPND